MVNGVSTALRLASRLACAIVIVSFALFAIDQAGNASAQQQDKVNESGTPSTAPSPKKSTAKKEKSSVREAIDEASAQITSPFDGVVAGLHNPWAIHGVRLLLALLVYGFGVGYLARMLRVRV